jgi:hypothetical protein
MTSPEMVCGLEKSFAVHDMADISTSWRKLPRFLPLDHPTLEQKQFIASFTQTHLQHWPRCKNIFVFVDPSQKYGFASEE